MEQSTRSAGTASVEPPPPADLPQSSGVGEALGEVIQAIDHVGIAVADLDTAVAFYTTLFGMVVTHREVNVEQGVAEAMIRPATASPSCTEIQLLAPLTPESAIARFIDRSGQGLQQVAFRVTDVRRAGELLRSRGIQVLYDEPKSGTRNSLINFVHPKDAGGVLIELVQPPA